MTQSGVLIVQDDLPSTSVLTNCLRMHGYRPLTERSNERTLAKIAQPEVAAAIVWTGSTADKRFDLVKRIRKKGVVKPILLMSPTVDTVQWISGIEAGASDHLATPFSTDELVARLSILLWRARSSNMIEAVLEKATRTVRQSGRTIDLTEREFALLEMLHTHAGEILSRGTIFDTLWANEGTSSENVVDVYIGYVRKKLSKDIGLSFRINTVRNMGYVLEKRYCS